MFDLFALGSLARVNRDPTRLHRLGHFSDQVDLQKPVLERGAVIAARLYGRWIGLPFPLRPQSAYPKRVSDLEAPAPALAGASSRFIVS
jgi:hypothetical protein